MKIPELIEQIKAEYSPYAEVAVSELQKADILREEWEKSSDPEWLAFRNNPKTIALYKHAANVYRSVRMALANDDGSLKQEERLKMHISVLWSTWFMRSLGGDPTKVKKEVENQIIAFAEAAGVPVDK